MNKKLKNLFIGLLSVFFVLLLLLFIALKPLDNSPYNKQAFYKNSLKSIHSTPHLIGNKDSIIACGWNKTNLAPPFKTCIAIDSKRNGKHFENISDSIYVRSIIFKQGNVKLAYVSLDLLICPPEVYNMLDTILSSYGYSNSNIFLSATHTHSSIGSWHDSKVGEIFAGKYDSRVPKHICDKIQESILAAEKDILPFTYGYFQVPTKKLVYNRLISGGMVDSMIRGLKILRSDGSRGLLYNFSAHATCLHGQEMDLSGDWPGYASKLFDSITDFSIFSAGAVGSHGPYKSKINAIEECRYLSAGVYTAIRSIWDTIPCSTPKTIYRHMSNLTLREPNFRVNKYLVIKPWLFNSLFGKEKIHLSSFAIDSYAFIGLPCDFSGELYPTLLQDAHEKQIQLMLTSFNGGFIGYITHDDRYDINAYETRTMNWFGPQNGAYFSELIKRELSYINSKIDSSQPE